LALYRLGELNAARNEAWRFHQSALELGDAQSAAMSLDAWTLASLGRVPAAIIQAEMARPSDDVQRAAQVMLAEAVRLLAEDRTAEAVEVLSDAVRRIRRAGLSSAFISPVYVWFATALRLQARASVGNSRQSQASLRRAGSAARRARRVAGTFQNDLPHALRECALLAVWQGRPGRTRRLFQQSLEVAERQGARYERAVTLQARCRVGADLNWPDAAAEAYASLSLPPESTHESDPRARI